jgi:DUF4097 and DUF4098 domain-containing protein YvlB
MKRLTILVIIFLSMISLSLYTYSAEKKEVNKTFKPKDIVKIKIVSGDCVVKKGTSSEIKVRLIYTYPSDRFEPIFKEEGNALILKEEFTGHGRMEGTSSWSVTVPGKTDIDFSSASGDFFASGLESEVDAEAASGNIKVVDFKGRLRMQAASGDIRVKKSDGDIMVKTASGDIDINSSKGVFSVKCASGKINGEKIVLKDKATFKTASGDIRVGLAKTAEYDMNLTSASGNIILDYNGHPVKGYFEFKGKRRNINSDVPFDNGDESHEYSPFVTRYFKKGGDSPKISIKTVSGELEFKK